MGLEDSKKLMGRVEVKVREKVDETGVALAPAGVELCENLPSVSPRKSVLLYSAEVHDNACPLTHSSAAGSEMRLRQQAGL